MPDMAWSWVQSAAIAPAPGSDDPGGGLTGPSASGCGLITSEKEVAVR